jgi:CRISPR system Cascade subunit CasE
MTYMVRARLQSANLHAAEDTLRDVYSAHKAVWSLFGDAADRKRDFLYRLDWDDGPRVLAVARREPLQHTAWHVETKPYVPALQKGDLLRFSLRANATRRSGGDGGRSDGRRHDIIMDAILKARLAGDEPDRRMLVQTVGLQWLARQGQAHGFSLPSQESDDESATWPAAYVASHTVHDFRKGRGQQQQVRVSGLDFEGHLRVEDEELFRRALIEGVGPAKGFGFGLLLVRRP